MLWRLPQGGLWSSGWPVHLWLLWSVWLACSAVSRRLAQQIVGIAWAVTLRATLGLGLLTSFACRGWGGAAVALQRGGAQGAADQPVLAPTGRPAAQPHERGASLLLACPRLVLP